MSTDIQRARDVLAKWREQTAGKSGPNHRIAWALTRHAPLLVGTAGNPDLLDAIDGLLAAEQDRLRWVCKCCEPKITRVGRIAAAIIAADERMSA